MIHKMIDIFKDQAQKKIQTTMIGALAKMEQNFGYLWGHFKDGPLTTEEEKFAELWDFTRNQILNQGNNQMRKLTEEYNDLFKIKYSYNFGKPNHNKDQ